MCENLSVNYMRLVRTFLTVLDDNLSLEMEAFWVFEIPVEWPEERKHTGTAVNVASHVFYLIGS